MRQQVRKFTFIICSSNNEHLLKELFNARYIFSGSYINFLHQVIYIWRVWKLFLNQKHQVKISSMINKIYYNNILYLQIDLLFQGLTDWNMF